LRRFAARENPENEEFWPKVLQRFARYGDEFATLTVRHHELRPSLSQTRTAPSKHFSQHFVSPLRVLVDITDQP
jgi:hypothetical protein